MAFLSTIRFQETYAMLTRLLIQGDEHQRVITITRSNTPQFDLLPLPLHKQFLKVVQPYVGEYPLATRHIGISAIRRCFLSYERTLQAFEESDEDRIADMLLVLRRNELVGSVFLHDRYMALLDFLASKDAALPEAFKPQQTAIEQAERLMTIVEAVHHFRDFPQQFDLERAEHGLSLPVLIRKQDQPVLVLLSQETWQELMLALQTGDRSVICGAVLDWWAARSNG